MGMKNVFGTPNLTLMKNVEGIDTLLIIGSEPDKNYPVFYNKILRRKDLRVFKIHSFIKGVGKEEVITIRPGSETCLLNGLINELLENGVTSNAEGLNRLKGAVMDYTPTMVCETCGLELSSYKKLVKAVIKSKKLGVFHGMGLTQHVNSLENVHSLLNLVLLKNAYILSLRGEINVQGAGDVSSSSCKGVKCKGLNIIEALLLSPAKALFLTEFDPFKSMPDLSELKQETKDSFIVYFGSYHNTTSARADVVIPIASLLGSEGSITNGERRIRKVNKVREEAPQLWKILMDFSKKFRKSKEFNYPDSKAIFDEITKNVKDYSHTNSGALWNGVDQWPDKRVKHRVFMPEEFDGLSDFTSDKYPFILTTFRSKYAFLSNEVTKNSSTLSERAEKPGFYLNPHDMNRLGLNEGEGVKVSSVAGSLKGKVYSSDRMPQGIIGAYIHYSSLMINTLFPLKFDEESFTPNYKSVAVNVKKS
jgi:formate dehydrogenase major subunit